MAINTTPFTTGQVLTSANVNDLPMGFNDSAGGTATTAIVAATPLAVLSKSFTIYADRRYKISGQCGWQPSGASTGNAIYFTQTAGISKVLWYRGDSIAANYPQYAGGTHITTATILGVTTGSSAETFTLYIRTGGAGSLNTNPDGIVGASSAEQLLWIEDIGAE
jgi:hypothetical protein